MTKGFLRLLLVILVFALAEQVVYADVAPPVPPVLCLSLGVVVALGFLVAIIVFVSALVIRRIKNREISADEE